MMYSGFPDLRFTMEEMIAEGDKVAERLTVRGTHEGEFMGVPPTGKQVEFPGMGVLRIREGKIVEFRAMPDMLGVLHQIGAVPEPGQEEARAAEGERDERGLMDKAKDKLMGQ
jgi:predicted ester cyclase